MKLLFILIGLCLAAPVLLLAELGQNELQVAETYGQPVSEQKKSDTLVERQYGFNGLSVVVTFLNGTSQCETFKKPDNAPLTEEQVEKILAANGNHLEWTAEGTTKPNARKWIIAGPKPSASEAVEGPTVFAVSSRRPSAMAEPAGEGRGRLIAVDTRTPDNTSSSPVAPSVLRRAVYTQEGTNVSLKVFTAAYESVSKQEQRQGRDAPNQ